MPGSRNKAGFGLALAALVLAQAGAGLAQQVTRGTGAVLRGLDKITSETTEMTLAPGEAVRYGRLELRLGECRYPTGNPSADAYAQLTIIDRNSGQVKFSGWMIASSPALSALDDARYDVWLISCNS